MDIKMEKIKNKVITGERLSREDGIYLFASDDLLSIGQMARWQKINKSQQKVFFNVNHHINLTNICKSLCRFCAFGRGSKAEGAYVMSQEEVMAQGEIAYKNGATEFHVVSAIHPDLPFSYYVNILKGLNQAYPDIHIQGFTAVEIVYFAQIAHLSIRETLEELIAVGLGSIPGGGAEILDDELRKKLCPNKANSEEWLEVHRIAHQLGLKTNCTMLYGHIESNEQRIDHLIRLRELQDEAPGFQAFIPLPFLPENTQLANIRPTTAYENIKNLAIARLMLDNIDHIKAFWIMLGIDVAQLALHFGADDLDGTIHEEKIMHAAGANTETGTSKDEIIRLIKTSGWTPVERDTVYNIIREY